MLNKTNWGNSRNSLPKFECKLLLHIDNIMGFFNEYSHSFCKFAKIKQLLGSNRKCSSGLNSEVPDVLQAWLFACRSFLTKLCNISVLKMLPSLIKKDLQANKQPRRAPRTPQVQGKYSVYIINRNKSNTVLY